MFKRYQHIERLGTDEVEGILDGTCYVFYKIDGTNGSVWIEDGEVKAGSRNRELTEEEDNFDFYKNIKENKQVEKYLTKYPGRTLYGEWLVPHSLKTYKESAWNKFYVFDIREGKLYVPYEEYKNELNEYGIDYIPAIAKIENPTKKTLNKLLDKTGDFLIKEGCGLGEGIVIKNYEYENKYGRKVWAKIVTTEFKTENKKTFKTPELKNKISIEEKIIKDFCTEAFIEKEYAKIKNFTNKKIPMLFGKTWHAFVNEEIWNIIKEYKKPTINFSKLYNLVLLKIKDVIDLNK